MSGSVGLRLKRRGSKLRTRIEIHENSSEPTDLKDIPHEGAHATQGNVIESGESWGSIHTNPFQEVDNTVRKVENDSAEPSPKVQRESDRADSDDELVWDRRPQNDSPVTMTEEHGTSFSSLKDSSRILDMSEPTPFTIAIAHGSQNRGSPYVTAAERKIDPLLSLSSPMTSSSSRVFGEKAENEGKQAATVVNSGFAKDQERESRLADGASQGSAFSFGHDLSHRDSHIDMAAKERSLESRPVQKAEETSPKIEETLSIVCTKDIIRPIGNEEHESDFPPELSVVSVRSEENDFDRVTRRRRESIANLSRRSAVLELSEIRKKSSLQSSDDGLRHVVGDPHLKAHQAALSLSLSALGQIVAGEAEKKALEIPPELGDVFSSGDERTSNLTDHLLSDSEEENDANDNGAAALGMGWDGQPAEVPSTEAELTTQSLPLDREPQAEALKEDTESGKPSIVNPEEESSVSFDASSSEDEKPSAKTDEEKGDEQLQQRYVQCCHCSKDNTIAPCIDCDRCGRSFHLACEQIENPSMLPDEGPWECRECTDIAAITDRTRTNDYIQSFAVDEENEASDASVSGEDLDSDALMKEIQQQPETIQRLIGSALLVAKQLSQKRAEAALCQLHADLCGRFELQLDLERKLFLQLHNRTLAQKAEELSVVKRQADKKGAIKLSDMPKEDAAIQTDREELSKKETLPKLLNGTTCSTDGVRASCFAVQSFFVNDMLQRQFEWRAELRRSSEKIAELEGMNAILMEQLSAVRDGRPLSTIPARRGSRAKSLSTKLLCQESALTNTTDAEIPSMFVPLEENVGLGEFLRRRRNLRGQVELRLGQPQAHRVAAISAGNGRSSEEIEPDDELRSEEIETDVRSKERRPTGFVFDLSKEARKHGENTRIMEDNSPAKSAEMPVVPLQLSTLAERSNNSLPSIVEEDTKDVEMREGDSSQLNRANGAEPPTPRTATKNAKRYTVTTLQSDDWDITFMPSSTRHQSVFEVRKIKAAKVDALVMWLCVGGSEYLNAFLLTFRAFVDPLDLLYRIEHILRGELPKDASEKWVHYFKNHGTVTRLKIINFLKTWAERFFDDFEQDLATAEKLKGLLRSFSSSGMRAIEKQASQLLRSLEQGLDGGSMGASSKRRIRYSQATSLLAGGVCQTARSITHRSTDSVARSYSDSKRDLNSHAEESDTPLSPSALKEVTYLELGEKGINMSGTRLLQLDSQQVARQLTLLDHALFSAIHPRELLSQAWTKDVKEQRSPNVLAMITRFNIVSRWVSSEVLRMEDPPKRAALVKKFIAIAKECRTLNNFNGTLAVVSGLSSSPVHRLKKTWTDAGKARKECDDMLLLLSREGNFKALRNALRQASQPCCPYLGMFLTDLTFIEDGNPSMIQTENGEQVNFFKLDLIAAVLQQIQQYQQTPYTLVPLPSMQKDLLALHVRLVPEEDLFRWSLKIEPRS